LRVFFVKNSSLAAIQSQVGRDHPDRGKAERERASGQCGEGNG
jgi:hypothetical protein